MPYALYDLHAAYRLDVPTGFFSTLKSDSFGAQYSIFFLMIGKSLVLIRINMVTTNVHVSRLGGKSPCSGIQVDKIPRTVTLSLETERKGTWCTHPAFLKLLRKEAPGLH